MARNTEKTTVRKPRLSKADRAAAEAAAIVEMQELADHARRVEEAQAIEDAAITEIEEQIALPKSVVAVAYKQRYRDRAAEKGRKGKAAKRSTWDWLAQTMAKIVLDDREKLVVPALEALLDANGVQHAHWNRTSPGWQGRLRMTGRLSLQRCVAEEEQLFLPDGSTIQPPRTWIAKHQH